MKKKLVIHQRLNKEKETANKIRFIKILFKLSLFSSIKELIIKKMGTDKRAVPRRGRLAKPELKTKVTIPK